jgi:hypothetical protein
MSRMTIGLAEEIARKMVAPLRKKQEAWKNQQKELIIDYYKSKFTQVDWDFCMQHKDFVSMAHRFELFGNGLSYEGVYFEDTEEERFPIMPKLGLDLYNEYTIKIVFDITKPKDASVSSEYVQLKNTISKYNVEMTKLERDIENTLKSLNTIKKCRENFPDCIPYLPLDPSTSQVPVIQIADITNRLQMFK